MRAWSEAQAMLLMKLVPLSIILIGVCFQSKYNESYQLPLRMHENQPQLNPLEALHINEMYSKMLALVNQLYTMSAEM